MLKPRGAKTDVENSTAQTADQSPLLRLPAELRINIWGYAHNDYLESPWFDVSLEEILPQKFVSLEEQPFYLDEELVYERISEWVVV